MLMLSLARFGSRALGSTPALVLLEQPKKKTSQDEGHAE
jgi:hypothetical protein